MDSIKHKDHIQRLKHFNSEGQKIAYVDEGNGPVILLLHGVPTSSWLYRKMIPLLSLQGYRVIAPDMLGYGHSDKPDSMESYFPENMGVLILKLMDFLTIQTWTHVFHDGGGLWTWEMLKQDSTKVSNLIMLNTIVYQSGFKPPIKLEEGFIAKQFTKLYCSNLGQRLALDGTFKNGITNKDVITSEMLGGYRAPFGGKFSTALYYFFTRTCDAITDYSELHRSLNIPTTVIWGKDDDMLVWKNVEQEMKDNFKDNLKGVHLLEAKHFIQEEKPEEIVGIILNVLKN